MHVSGREKLHMYRVIPLTILVFVTFAISAFFCFFNKLYMDEMVIVAYIDVLFLALLIFELEFERLRGQVSSNRSTTFSRVAGVYIICSAIVFGSAFLPDFARPYMLIPFLIYAVSNEMISIICSTYLLLIFAITSSGDLYEVLCYCFLMVFGCMLAKAFNVKRFRVWLCFIIFAVSTGNLVLFYYLDAGEISQSIVIRSLVVSLVTTVLAAALTPVFRKESNRELKNRILDIMSEDYSVVKELKKYFPADYNHAKRVAAVSKRCAEQVGLNPDICEAAGFYYRIGKWQGEPHVKNGVVRAKALCFPTELVAIISEYYGEENLPSTPESALVHMVDAITIKITALEQDVGLSTWNQEMIIYQALNELSNKGIYDESGLSMNHFLKIREFLAKENWVE